MEAEGLPAIKVLLQHVFASQALGNQLTTEGGLRYDRVWVQGTCKTRLGSSITLDDGTAEGGINVVVGAAPPAGVDTNVRPGDYLLVVGKLVTKGGSSRSLWHIKAHKIINLTASDPQAASQRMMQWNAEVMELHRSVYPSMARAQQ